MKAETSILISAANTDNSLVITDHQTKGVTILVTVNRSDFNLPRQQMIEALEYILRKLKS